MSDLEKFARPRRIVDTGRCTRIEAHILMARALIEQIDAVQLLIAAEAGLDRDDDRLQDVIWNGTDIHQFLFDAPGVAAT
jgi:hypothetical protein